MSTIEDIKESKVIIAMKPKESVLVSFTRDLITFSFLGFCIFLSQESTFWTLITGGMFLVFGSIKLKAMICDNATTFKNKEEAVEFLNTWKP